MLFQLLMNPRAVRQDPRAPVGTPRGDAASPWPAESLRVSVLPSNHIRDKEAHPLGRGLPFCLFVFCLRRAGLHATVAWPHFLSPVESWGSPGKED